VLVLLLTAAGALAMPFVRINYNLTDYLPDEAESTRALRVLDQTFAEGIPNLNVYLPDVSIPEALEFKAKIAALRASRTCAVAGRRRGRIRPLESQDTALWWRLVPGRRGADGRHGDSGRSVEIVSQNQSARRRQLRPLRRDRKLLLHPDLEHARSLENHVLRRSRLSFWSCSFPQLLVEPLLFLATIGVAILLNEGSNIFLGEISFVTRASSASCSSPSP
jgi:hypothetical protein